METGSWIGKKEGVEMKKTPTTEVMRAFKGVLVINC